MPDVATYNASSIEEAREIASGAGGPVLVLASETLQQIQDAEAAGGYEGGQTGSAGEGGYSESGVVPDSSSASDPPPVELLDMYGATSVGVWLEETTEKLLDLKDVWEAFKGEPLGPVILVPKRELERWLGGGAADWT